MAPFIHSLAIGCGGGGEISTSHHELLILREGCVVTLNKKLRGPQNWSEQHGERRIAMFSVGARNTISRSSSL